ncbi:hypothetical protein [Candidatus Borreliella tachyglossi]|uniref:hypothetical protein n=1 Tax=Candidatus Borreliella tachyglossi TaxID=1964448 RepID=UPI0040414B6D
MRVFLNFVYVFFIFLFFLSCSTVSTDEFVKDDLDLLVLKTSMIYPELKISDSEINNYKNLSCYHDHNFDILKGDQEDPIYISESSYNNNIEYVKELYLYNKRLYKLILAYSTVQGSSFKFEIFKYLHKHDIKEKFPLRIRFPIDKELVNGSPWVVIGKNYFDILIQDKSALIVANQRMENIIRKFSK